MGLFDSIGEIFGEVTGFGSNGNPNPHNMDENAYSELYNEALAGIKGVGASGKNLEMREGIENSALSMLGDLENNAAGRKANFQEDMARGFSADMQNRARAAGGTGNLAQVLSPGGGFYDSQARAQSRGLNDLYGQAINDLGNLGGVQNQFFNQDFEKANTAANLQTGELAQKRGIAAGNLENTFNSEQAGRERRLNTFGGITKGIGGAMSFMGGGG